MFRLQMLPAKCSGPVIQPFVSEAQDDGPGYGSQGFPAGWGVKGEQDTKGDIFSGFVADVVWEDGDFSQALGGIDKFEDLNWAEAGDDIGHVAVLEVSLRVCDRSVGDCESGMMIEPLVAWELESKEGGEACVAGWQKGRW